MTFQPALADYAILVVLAAGMTYELIFPRLKQRAISYVVNCIILWCLSLAVLALWYVAKRPFSLLFLGSFVWWRFAIGFAVFFAVLWLALRNRRAARANPKALQPLEKSLAPIKWLMPTTPRQMVYWTVVSITAGITEEVLIRGFLVAFIAHYMGLPAGVILSAAIFGLGHAYQEPKNAVPTGLYGLGLNVVVLVSGSLIPAMAIHVAQDYFTGELAYWALSRNPDGHKEIGHTHA